MIKRILGISPAAWACLQTELISIANEGKVTDYLTGADEITMSIGVGEDFVYYLAAGVHEGQKFEFFPGSLSFPCFQDSALWVQITEIDSYQDDTATVQLDCKNLQLGENQIRIELHEDGGTVQDAARVVDEWFGWSFGFVGDSTGATVEPAIYDLNFQVTETCTGEYFGSPPPGITVD